MSKIKDAILPVSSSKKDDIPKVHVLIHPQSQGYLKRSIDDWNKCIVKQQGSILLPDGREARPGASYAVDPSPEIVSMVADGILLAGSKVI
jgi:hypothetical protein